MPCGWRVFPHRIERQPRPPVFQANPGEHAKALRLDKDLLPRSPWSDLLTRVVVSANEPFAVQPCWRTVSSMRAPSAMYFFASSARPRRCAIAAISLDPARTGGDETDSATLLPCCGGLERLARRIGEAVQVETVVPIGAADQRQTMRAKPFERVMETAPQCSYNGCALPGWLSNSTARRECSSRRSLSVGRDAKISQCGSSLKLPPISLFPSWSALVLVIGRPWKLRSRRSSMRSLAAPHHLHKPASPGWNRGSPSRGQCPIRRTMRSATC